MSGLKNNLPGTAGAGGILLEAWSKLLTMYADGQQGLNKAIETGLGQIPLIGPSGLGKWASKLLGDLMKDIGFEAPNLNPLKPVLVNSYYVAHVDNKGFSTKYLNIRDTALKIDNGENQILSAIASKEELAAALNLSDVLSGQIEIATIKPLGDIGPSIPLTIKLPKFATSTMDGILSNLTTTLQELSRQVLGGRVWR